MSTLNCLQAYDIRGPMPGELNEGIVWRIGRAIAEYLKPEIMVIGGDICLSAPSLKAAELLASIRSR
ncbi:MULTISPECIES: hypothetical protein [unclassified Endozoicomonas]|uniref:hypothetical protein n=1 Tax=unclassified Endozoicomonas TaxID=2644528 RepID=UPI0021474F98|nr:MULTISPECIES: hypothetical protein [unclassified Endozoicomonas]